MQIKIEQSGKTPQTILKELDVYLKRTLPIKVGNTAVLFFKENIRTRQGFLDTSIEGWQESKSGLQKKVGSKMLIDGGKLLQGITHSTASGKVMVYVIGVPSKYAEIHNTGGTIVVTPKMKKFFWAKYYDLTKKLTYTSKETLSKSKANIAIGEAAQYYKNLALATKLIIPKRKFIGSSHALDLEINQFIERDLQTIFNT